MMHARRGLGRGGGWKTQAGYYAMFLVPALWMFLFSYLPMAGIYLAFIDYKPARGIAGSAFVGLKFFRQFFESIDCRRIIVNTLMYNVVRIALLNVFVGMLFALLLYEIKSRMANRIFQTAMLLPSFLSWTVVSAALMMMLHPARGVLNELLQALGLSPVSWYKEPKYWPTIIQLSYIYKDAGMASIYYFAALLSVDTELFDAASIDGAGRLKRVIHIDLPCILPTAAIMLIMRAGSVMSVGFEKVYLMQNSVNLAYSEIISTYVYKVGMQDSDFSYSTAIGLFNSVVNLALLVAVNTITKKLGETSLF